VGEQGEQKGKLSVMTEVSEEMSAKMGYLNVTTEVSRLASEVFE